MRQMLSFAFLGAILTLSLFTACKPDGPIGKTDTLTSIPEDVTMVTTIDVPQLMDKADFENVKNMEFYQAFLEEVAEEDPALAEVFKDPKSSGIDLEKPVNVAFLPDPSNPENMFVGAVANLADEGAFSALVEAAAEQPITEQAGYKSVQSNRNSIIAWNKDMVVLGGSEGSMEVNSQVERIFTTEPEGSVAKNKDLQKALSGDHDIATWLSTNSLAENEQAKFAMGMAQLDAEALKDNYLHGSLDFEDGQILGSSQYFINKGLSKDFDKLFNDQITTDFSKFVPGEGLVYAVTNAINLRGIDEILSARPQSKGFLEYALKEYGLTVEDIINTFGGDILLAGYAGEDGKDKGIGLFATNVVDRKKLDSFLELAQDYDMIEEEGDGVYKIMQAGLPGVGGGFTVKTSDGFGRLLVTKDMVFISGDDALINKLKKGAIPKAERVNKDILKLLNSNLFAGYFGLDAIKNFDEDLENLDIDEVKISTTREKSDLQMDLKEKNENALKSLFEMINKSYLKSQEKEKI